MKRVELPACAAIRDETGTIIAGKRHHDCLAAAHRLGVTRRRWEQGFMTTSGLFANREEALNMVLGAGLPSAAPGGYRYALGELFSEDLY